ncbi:MAG TPA: hypothetical protein VG710_00175 [Opitutus sp.]|nr:hypothetical protein [Opitutus sp.]
MDEANRSGRWSGGLILVAVVALPLAGARIAQRPTGRLFEFPPRPGIPSDYPRFSWIACGLVAGGLAALAASWIWAGARRRGASDRETGGQERNLPARAFPRWGWIALVWTIGWWVLAWTRFPWFAALQRLTFFPLWLGFIAIVNALAWRRAGTCFMLAAPRRWFALFVASAGFWWVFEWLNRFVRNWHYVGVEDFGAAAYAVDATVCFSIVLPAVFAVREWLGTFRTLDARLSSGPSWSWLARRGTATALVGLGALALALTGVWPDWFYPAVWAAPLALGLGAGILTRRPGIAGEVAKGDWRRAGAWTLAALVCGFFWEMWNVRSAAKWIYTVPYADRWHVFEMPLPGYAGYLPFGLECALVVEWMFGSRAVNSKPFDSNPEAGPSPGRPN